MKKYVTEFKLKLKNLLGRRNDDAQDEYQPTSSEDAEMAMVTERAGPSGVRQPSSLEMATATAGTSRVRQPSNLDFLHQELRRYQQQDDQQVEHTDEVVNRRWSIDVDIIRSKLLLEYAAWNKVPIFSEKKVCNVLLTRSAPDLLKKLADIQTAYIHSGDVHLEYWYWKIVPDQSKIDPQVRCRVTFEKGGRRRNSNELRACWAMPLLVITEEIRYFIPLMEKFRRGDGSSCFFLPPDCHDGCMMQYNRHYFDLIEERYPGDYQFMVVNYRVFDSVIPNRVISLCFDVLMQKMDFSKERQEDGSLCKVNATANKMRFLRMVDYFLRIPIHVTGENEYIIAKDRGIPQGSCFTHLIRSMCNLVITWTVSNMVFQRSPHRYRFHGKKCVLVYDNELALNLNRFSECAKTHFGVVVDRSRTCITADVEDFHCMGYCCDTDE